MKHAKKLLALLLALTMVFSLVACGGNNTSDGNNDAPVVEVENNDDATDAQTGDETEAPVGTDGEAVYVRDLPTPLTRDLFSSPRPRPLCWTPLS